jgi:hypothetical protein
LKRRSALRPNSVFLNLPFDPAYEGIFVAYVVGLVTLGLEPRSILEVDEDGEGRMGRLYKLIEECGCSIHDISYRGPEFRYNMPFELGVAYALTRSGPKRKLVVFEAKKRDLLKTLTDLRHFDPKVHGMQGRKALAMIYECFTSPSFEGSEEIGRDIYRRIVGSLPAFRDGRSTVFNRKSFQWLIHVTAKLAAAKRASC